MLGGERDRLFYRCRFEVQLPHHSSACMAAHTRKGNIGIRCSRWPVATAMALATAPTVGTHGGSPTPLLPNGPPSPSLTGASTKATLIGGASGAVRIL